MATVISKIGIKDSTGSGYDTRDIGAKGQNVEVGYDAEGKVIIDVDVTTPTTTKTLTEVLQENDKITATLNTEKAPKDHRWTDDDTTDYGKADATHYGHIRLGTGLYVDSDAESATYGSTNVSFAEDKEVAENKAVQANDSRLSEDRKNPNAVTFSNGKNEQTYDGSAALTVSYDTVGSAPAGHTSIKADASTLGHVIVSTGLTSTEGALSVSYGTTAGTACAGNDSRLSDNRTPKSHAASDATMLAFYGAGTGSQYGHVMLTDTYSVTTPSAATNGAATSIAASAYALQQAYNTLNSKINVNEYKNITSDFDKGTFSSNLSSYNPGNYIVKTYGGTTYVAVLADYNYFYNPGRSDYANINQNHWVAVVLGFTTGQMNSSNTTAGGFSGSAMFNWLNNDCKAAVLGAFGSSHLIPNLRRLSKGTYNSSSATHGFNWDWSDTMYACLMSEVQVFGSKSWSDLGWSTGEANRQLKIFKNASFMEVLGRNYGQSNNVFNTASAWLRDIGEDAPGTNFCSAGYSGSSSSGSASLVHGRYPIINLK